MRSLGFGIERLGLYPIRYPWQTLTGLLVFTGFCIVGLFSLQPEGRLSEIYRGNSANYADYERISKLFPVSELDVLLLVSGTNLLDQKKLDEVRGIQEDVEFMEGVNSTLSMFSLRGKPDLTGTSPPLFPAEMQNLSQKAYKKALKQIEDHPDVYGNMLSKKGPKGEQTSLIIVTLKEDSIKEGTLFGVLENLEKEILKLAKPANLNVQFSGIPVIQQEIRNSINFDTVVFNIVGFLLGTVISYFFIRNIPLVIMVSFASIFANIWVLGILGHFGQTMNAFMTIVPPLIMVIAVSDGMHMVLAILHDLRDGKTRQTAIKNAVLSIGPACVLTSLTTTIALLTMTMTDSAVIRTFGITAGMGTIAAFISVILVIPTMSMLMIKDEATFRDVKDDPWGALKKIEVYSTLFASWTLKWWRDITAIGTIILIFFTILHLQLKPKYQLGEEIPDIPSLNNAMDVVNNKLGGGDYIHILVNYTGDKTIMSPDVLSSIGEAHRLLGAVQQVSDVSSIEKTRLWFRDNDLDNIQFLKSYIEKMPEHLQQRLFNKEKKAAIVSGKIADLAAPELARLVDKIKVNLNNMSEEFPGISFTVSGLSAVSAIQSTNIIGQLNQGLLLAVVIVVILIGLAFRSLGTALLSIGPNLFPIVAAGAVLHFSDSGLQFASILGLTVAFGLAVDDSIHFFNRYFLEREMLISADSDQKGKNRIDGKVGKSLAIKNFNDEIQCVKNTIVHIGPVLILTTLILICGLSVTILSDLSMTRLFGELTMATLVTALLADIFFLPAVILTLLYGKRAYQRFMRIANLNR